MKVVKQREELQAQATEGCLPQPQERNLFLDIRPIGLARGRGGIQQKFITVNEDKNIYMLHLSEK